LRSVLSTPATIAKSGFSKKDVRIFSGESAKFPGRLSTSGAAEKNHPGMDEDALITPTAEKENLIIIVVGGPGKHSSYLPAILHIW